MDCNKWKQGQCSFSHDLGPQQGYNNNQGGRGGRGGPRDNYDYGNNQGGRGQSYIPN